MAEFNGLRSASLSFPNNGREGSFFDVVAAQLTPKVFLFIVHDLVTKRSMYLRKLIEFDEMYMNNLS